MGSNFSINPNFQMNNFDNSIQDFNKVFSNSVDKTNHSLSSMSEFDKIFNDMSNSSAKPIQAGVEHFIGLDSINAQKIDNLSDSARMAHDIQSGFSNALNDLNAVGKKAEEDFETFATGGDISVHDVMISAQKSSLAMQMAIQLRNQMLNAYNELKNLSI